MTIFRKYIFILVNLMFISHAFSQVKITFPEEELATESILPKFETTSAVKNRKVNHKGKFEINFMGGMVASEPIYDPLSFGLSLSYHFNNTQGIHIMGLMFSSGLSKSGKSLQEGNVISDSGDKSGQKFDALKAPHKESMLAIHYQYTSYYGKISLTHENIMNLTLSGLIGGGFYSMKGLTVPAVNLGLSQRLYFNSSVAFRFDILFSVFNGPNITSAGTVKPNEPAPDVKDFNKTIQFDTNIYMGVSFLL